MSDQIDTTVRGLWDTVAKRKAEISEIESSKWVTNCVFNIRGGSSNVSDVINIQTLSKVEDVIRVAAVLIRVQDAFEKAAKALGEKTKFSHQGYSAEQWMQDFKTRIQKIRLGEKRKKLKELELRLDGLLSPELKRQLELERVAKEIEEMD